MIPTGTPRKLEMKYLTLRPRHERERRTGMRHTPGPWKVRLVRDETGPPTEPDRWVIDGPNEEIVVDKFY